MSGAHHLLTIFGWESGFCEMFFTTFPQVLSDDGRSKFDSVLHTKNDDDLYGFSAINVELVDCRC